MSEPYATWKPECDPGWKCERHGLETLNDSSLGLIRQMLGGVRFASMQEAADYYNNLPDSEGFKLVQSTSDVDPCANCQQVSEGLEQLLSEPAQE